MKWLLISNFGNPGDEWVRMGIERLIRSLDSDAKFIVRERDHNDDLREPAEFDYSVLCGMPIVWSHLLTTDLGTTSWSSTFTHGSWGPLSTWCSEDQKMIIAGFGMYMICRKRPEDFEMLSRGNFSAVLQEELFDRCRLVYSRSPLASELFPGVRTLPCPSVFAIEDPRYPRTLKLCNLMPGGAHYPIMCPETAQRMNERIPELSAQLMKAGFTFVAHRPAEEKLARELGWSEPHLIVFDGDAEKLLRIYARCRMYFGNRIHGAIVSRSFGADVICCGYDTRLADVEYLGGRIYTPWNLPDLRSWMSRSRIGESFDRDGAFREQRALWQAALR